MARLPYVDETTHPGVSDIAARIRSGRRGKLIPVYGMLLHSPEVAEAWLGLLDAIRWKTKLSSLLRELVILRVAALNACSYVIDVHMKHYAVGDGLSIEKCHALLDLKADFSMFEPVEQATIKYVDEVTLHCSATEATFEQLRNFFDERQLLELTVLVGTYNMHTRVVRALELDP